MAMRKPTKKKTYTTVHLWRHPEVMGHEEMRFYGHTNVGLTKRGQTQMRAMAEFMSSRQLNAVYSSDLKRSRLSAEAIGRAQSPRKKNYALEELRELNLGKWEGLTYREIEKRHPGGLKERMSDLANFAIEEGESVSALRQRVLPAFQDIVNNHLGQKICVVAHGGVNRIILGALLGAPLEHMFRIAQDYAHLNIIDIFEDGTPVVRCMNRKLPPPAQPMPPKIR